MIADHIDLSELEPDRQRFIRSLVYMLVANPDDNGIREQLGLCLAAYERDEMSLAELTAWTEENTPGRRAS